MPLTFFRKDIARVRGTSGAPLRDLLEREVGPTQPLFYIHSLFNIILMRLFRDVLEPVPGVRSYPAVT